MGAETHLAELVRQVGDGLTIGGLRWLAVCWSVDVFRFGLLSVIRGLASNSLGLLALELVLGGR